MRLHDGTILMHGKAPYDPVKAHEYYMRTRQLKGRKKGSPTYSVKLTGGRAVNLTEQQLTEQRLYAAKRVADIKGKLAELNSKLKEAMREAQKKKAEAEKPKSAAEKAEAAREAKKYRNKNRQKLAAERRREAVKKKTAPKSDPVSELQEKIGEIKKRLSQAVAKQRALAGATRNS